MIKIGVAGLSSWGRMHLEVLAALAHFKVVALCDKDKSTLRSCGERYGVTNLSEDINDFLAEDFDAVDLILPHFLSCDAAVKAANVKLADYLKAGGGRVNVIVRGDVAAVKASVEAGVASASQIGKVLGSTVIPRPSDKLVPKFPIKPAK